jgi:hypothetical protein
VLCILRKFSGLFFKRRNIKEDRTCHVVLLGVISVDCGFTGDGKGSCLVCISLVLAEINRYDCYRLQARSEDLSLPGLKPARRQYTLYHTTNVDKQVCFVMFIWLTLLCQIFYPFTSGPYKELFKNCTSDSSKISRNIFSPASGHC